METKLTINGLDSHISYCEATGLSKCFKAYADYFANEYIFEVGFNENSGYTYIALEEKNITICSMLGNDVEYLVTDLDNGKEYFFDNYQDAENHLQTINA